MTIEIKNCDSKKYKNLEISIIVINFYHIFYGFHMISINTIVYNYDVTN